MRESFLSSEGDRFMKKSILIIALCSLIAILAISCKNEPQMPPDSVWDGITVDTSWYKGKEDENSFSLDSASQLAGFAALVNDGNTFEGKTVTLRVNVDLDSNPWTPIGTGIRSGKTVADEAKVFSGTFDGKNHSIKNLVIADATVNKDNCVGFFGIVKAGKVSNVVFKKAKVTAINSEVAGIAVGYAIENSTIENVRVEAKSFITAPQAGGIVGRMTVSGTISNCENYASVLTTSGGAGGIVGKAYYSEAEKTIAINNSKNYGTISATNGGYVGGIAGLFAGEMTSCENNGKVTGTNISIGGIVGEMTNYGFVKSSTNNSEVTCTGINETSSIYGLGGIVGWIRYQNNASYGRTEIIEISGNTNKASVAGNDNAGVGGIVGMLYNVGKIENNTSNAPQLKGKLFVSGIVGAHQIDSGNKLNEDENIKQTTVKNNTSTTSESAIVGLDTNPCRATIIYLNSAEKIPAENITGNTPKNENLK